MDWVVDSASGWVKAWASGWVSDSAWALEKVLDLVWL
jgi:hypothetical protein